MPRKGLLLKRKNKARIAKMKSRPADEATHPKLDDWFKRIQVLKKVMGDDAAMVTVFQRAAMDYMNQHGIESYQGVGIIAGHDTVLDAEALKEAVGPQVWQRITDRVLNQDKLTAAVEKGIVPADVVEECMTLKERKPYLGMQYWKPE